MSSVHSRWNVALHPNDYSRATRFGFQIHYDVSQTEKASKFEAPGLARRSIGKSAR